MSAQTYRTIAAPALAEWKSKGSRFIAHAFPVTDTTAVKQHIDALRQQHHKARHWCYAYRLGTEGTAFRANDDGEPSGSAGRPILGQIDSAGLTDVLIIVVRYFGGTLLGVPGLIQAYKNSSAAALASAEILEKDIEKTVSVLCSYSLLGEVLHTAKQHRATLIRQDMQLECHLIFRIPLSTHAACLASWSDKNGLLLNDGINEPPPAPSP